MKPATPEELAAIKARSDEPLVMGAISCSARYAFLIAQAREDIPRLLATIEAKDAEIERLREWLTRRVGSSKDSFKDVFSEFTE